MQTRLGELEKAKPRTEDTIEQAEADLAALVKKVCEATMKADAIEAVVYDLKAVNPNHKANMGARTPNQPPNLIEATVARSPPSETETPRGPIDEGTLRGGCGARPLHVLKGNSDLIREVPTGQLF